MQVDATLRSFFVHCHDPENVMMSVLYTCSTSQHEKQYTQLIQEWKIKPQVRFIKEHNFRKDLLNILNPYHNHFLRNLAYRLLLIEDIRITRRIQPYLSLPYTNESVMFLVDDSIFTSGFNVTKISSALSANPNALGFSLRLGKNVTYSYMLRQDQKQPIFLDLGDNIQKFNWVDSEKDFNYPLEVSSSIYRTIDIIKSIIGSHFSNPNFLEGVMNVNKNKFSSSHPNLLCYTNSVAFCNPINIVQSASLENRQGEQFKYSSTELADLFDKGKRINIDPYTHYLTNSCHTELKLHFRETKVKNE
jgi:hypothetical protein